MFFREGQIGIQKANTVCVELFCIVVYIIYLLYSAFVFLCGDMVCYYDVLFWLVYDFMAV